jgi:hemolysin activation/secretion protein
LDNIKWEKMMGIRNSCRRPVPCYSSNDRSDKSITVGKTSDAFSSSLALAFTTTCLLFSPISFAQSNSGVERLTQSLTERIKFDVNRFEIQGETPLSSESTKVILAPYLGQERGIDDIESAADALEKAMIDRGLSFYRVSFPPQELTDGVVDLLITRYMIGDINIQGNSYYSNKNIESSLPVLRKGASPSTKGIARAINVANQSAGKRIRVSLAPGDVENEINANVVVVDQKPLLMTSWLNNTGTGASGSYRVGASVSHRNIFDLDHTASLTFITSPEGINDVQQIAASYSIPLYSRGGKLNFVAVNSDVDAGIVADVFDVAGRGEIYGVGYSHTLPTIGSYNQGLALQVQDKLFDNDVRFQGRQVLDDVRSRPLSLAYQANWGNVESGAWSGSVSATSNLSGGSFNNARFYDVSRSGATDDWTKLGLGIAYQHKIKEWLYTAALRVAVSSDRLITGEQFAVGGSSSVRGLNERELRGDEGYQINLQAWAPAIVYGIRPVAFVDMAYVSNNQPLASEFSSEDVMSIGVLLNWSPTSNTSTSVSYGYLVDGIESDDPATNSADDGQLHFNLTYRF